MRVIAGTARGRRLQAPPGLTVRPTSDRVREAVFDMLAARDAVAGARVLDLFAGTGAFGIEALSRGAAQVTFVEQDRDAVAAIRSNLAGTGLASAPASLVRAEVVGWLEVHRGEPFDVAFSDPPYSFASWPAVLERLPAGLAVLESDREVDPGETWRVLKVKRYGGTVVSLVAKGVS